ncbi:MAG: hypothetical protein HZA94_03875 [Candidatus Vogelbacteria bacterium]|nr:hypothetical protein [Candidatus Vogelbacteria bacterium]
MSFFCLIVRGAIEFLDYCDGTSGQGRKFQDSLNILGDMMRDLAVARTSESLIPGKFLELFSSDAGLLHLYYDKWKTVMLTGDANERSSLEKAVADIEENIRQLVGSGVALDPDVREREIANFRSLLEKLTKRLGTVKSEETLRGDSVDEQIAKHVVEYMTREERPLLRSDEDGAETVANLELAPHLDGPLPDLSTPDDRDEARLDGRTRTRS